jgi:hypothetical protein
VAGYLYAKHDATRDRYLRSALAAKVDATILTQLRTGETEKAIKSLGSLLDGELMSLNSYEENTSPSVRSPDIYSSVAVVRAYYERFPDAERPTYGEKGLALKQQ